MPTNPPNTLVRTSHALTIRANGITVGVIQSWAPGMNRGITPVYEINVATSGEPIENVPGNVGGLTIQVSRYDLYTKRMEAAFGTPDVEMLGDHNNPFQLLELWRFPDNTQEGRTYDGCWFNNIGRTYSATDARLVMVNAGISYVRRRRTI
jgi:hypothetical protein